MLLGLPVYHCHVNENYESRPGAAVNLVPCVVRVNKHAQGDIIAKWLRSIQGFGLLNIPIERCPILIGLEFRHVDPRVTRVKYQHGVLLNLQVGHDVQCIY